MGLVRVIGVIIALCEVSVVANVLPASAKAPDSPQTFEVLVGLENPHQGIGVMAYFPDNVTVHAGDTVYTLIVGDMTPGPEPNLCLLHDTGGMKDTITAFPK